MNLLLAREGGKTTVEIMDMLLKRPYNKNQLAKQLDVDYNTISHHIKIMHNHEYITQEKFDGCFYYHPSDKLFKSIEEYKLIKEYLFNE